MTILDNNQINNECLFIKNRIINENNIYSEHIKLLYYTGIRISEVVQNENLYITTENDLFVFMPKTKRYRIIKYEPFLDEINLNLLLSINQSNYINEQNLKREIQKFSSYRRLYSGNKSIISHLFRHNFAKQQYEILKDYSKVNEKLQEQNLSVCINYIDSTIYY